MHDKGMTRFLAGAHDKVQDPCRKAGVFKCFCQVYSRQWCVFSWFQYHRVPRYQGWHHLPGRHGHRKVPVGDGSHNADRVSECKDRPLFHLGRCDHAEIPPALSCTVKGHVYGLLNVSPALIQYLSHFAANVLCKIVLMGREILDGPVKIFGPLRRRCLLPSLQCILCGRCSQFYILFPRLWKKGDLFPAGRIDILYPVTG